MSYFHLAEKTQEFSALAFERIREFDILPTPENYELWFVYFSKSNPEMLKAVDSLLDSEGGKLTHEQCYALFQEYLSGSREEKTVEKAGSQIQQTIVDVNVAVTAAKKNAQDYSHNLKSAKDKISLKENLEDTKPFLDEMLSDTEKMIACNDHLEEMLECSTRAMEDMRRDLEIARKEALTDPLTGLSNRKAFDQEIRRLVTLSNDSSEPHTFSMILMDIDHFKDFNDNFGHQIGDQVLKLVARTIKDSVKGRDVVVRFGGEEFVVLLPETNIQGGTKIAEILRQEVEKKEVINKATGKKLAKITLSAGVAQYNGGEDSDDLVERVDKALYEAKNTGRNRIVSVKP
ncbi:MAG: GGDEF domain-containing protein [Alphaproteobacteria bacterium]